MTTEQLKAAAQVDANVVRNAGIPEQCFLKGRYEVVCRDKDGNEKWRDFIDNTVVTVGKNLILDTVLAGAAYTTTGPFMGLISSTSYSAIAAADTMSSHGGWLEAGNAHAPTYSGARATCSFTAASAGVKALSAAVAFTMTGSGTVKGCFVVFGSGALSTIDDTSGTLLSAGLFSTGDKVVSSTDVINVTWSLGL